MWNLGPCQRSSVCCGVTWHCILHRHKPVQEDVLYVSLLHKTNTQLAIKSWTASVVTTEEILKCSRPVGTDRSVLQECFTCKTSYSFNHVAKPPTPSLNRNCLVIMHFNAHILQFIPPSGPYDDMRVSESSLFGCHHHPGIKADNGV